MEGLAARIILGVALAMLGAAELHAQGASVALPAGEIVASRKAMMDLQSGVMAAMKSAVEQKTDVKGFVTGAKALAASAKAVPGMFPVGTEKVGDTKAKPAIWSDTADFAKDADALAAAAATLAALADAEDKPGFAAQFAEVGKTCLACHRQYKERD